MISYKMMNLEKNGKIFSRKSVGPLFCYSVTCLALLIRAMVDARISQNLTQKELAERTGINQADISKLENGTRNPSLKLLKRLADGMGMTLKLEFVPKSAAKN